MEYISTRGKTKPINFVETALEGLARDGGLLVPKYWPDFSGRLKELESLSYRELALEIFSPFVGDEISKDTLKVLIDKSYAAFSTSEPTPLRFTDRTAILELFHGPTLAFKDVALQFLGNLFEEILKQKNSRLNILGATSGDTGSAAIYGVKGKERINIFMLHPQGRVSPVQEKQMTSVLDSNVFNIAVKGTFDDAQNAVKKIFNDLEFKDKYNLGAVNSINWVRIMAQIVYYFYAAFQLQKRHKNEPIIFSVPTGNFGNIFAAYASLKMGLPIKKLILATNENDILYRTLNAGVYKTDKVQATLSPSMDIQIASNFERFLFDLLGRDGAKVEEKMEELRRTGEFSLSDAQLNEAQSLFTGERVDTKETLATIKKYDKLFGIILDPHTAVGVSAAEKSSFSRIICLATAHPAKFSEAALRAVGKEPEPPEILRGILNKESKCIVSEADYREVEEIIERKLEG